MGKECKACLARAKQALHSYVSVAQVNKLPFLNSPSLSSLLFAEGAGRGGKSHCCT
ncbi:hypothetical protein CCP3SC15_780006 [Gammaproteobacteria bacterium]